MDRDRLVALKKAQKKLITEKGGGAGTVRPGTPLTPQDAQRLIQQYVEHYNTHSNPDNTLVKSR